MDTLKKIGNKIKVILTQLIAFLLSFFRTEPSKEQKVLVREDLKNDTPTKDNNNTNIASSNDPLPDEEDTKSDNHLNFKQSVYTINKDQKEEIRNRAQSQEIYFSEIVIINTIVEVIEENNKFKFSELSDTKKEKVKKEVEKINERITPSIKKEMLNNKIKTKEELKDNISKRITNLHRYNNPIKTIIEEVEIQKEEVVEPKKEIIIEKKELNIKPTPPKEEIVKVEEEKKDKIISLTPITKEEPTIKEETKIKNDFITITKEEKHSSNDKVYFMADIISDKVNNLNIRENNSINMEKALISETKKDTAEAIKIKSKKVPFVMVPTDKKNKTSAKEKIKNAVIDTTLLLASIPSKKENTEEEEVKEIVKDTEPIKTIYKSDEEEKTPEEIKIADIAVDREILEDIKYDIKKQQTKLNPFIEAKEEQQQKKIDNIKNMEKVKDLTLDFQQEMIDNKKELINNIDKEKNDIIDKIDEVKEDIKENIKEEVQEIKEEKDLEKTIALPIVEIELENKEKLPKEEEVIEEKEEKEEIIEEDSKENIDLIGKNEEIKEDADKKEVKTKIINFPNKKAGIKENVDEDATKAIFININELQKENDEIKQIHNNAESISINADKEIKKEELEDKEYEKIEKQIDDLLYDIEMYNIKNEDTITPIEKEKLNKEKNKLKALKTKLEIQKEKDIENEKKELEAELTTAEIKGIQKELKKLHLEHQEEVDDNLLEKLRQLENTNDDKMAEIEQKLIKAKLKKAAHAAEIPSILALPFIRHKYFFYFTIGLFVNNHFNFLNALFKRKETLYQPIDLTEIKNGYDALENALEINYKNIVYLDYLESEAITKYPNLKNDEEFIVYINRLRIKLNKNYERLEKKQKMINKYIKKVTKKNQVYKKYKLVKDNKEAA